ncbi:MFS transporter [Enterococcus olivae]
MKERNYKPLIASLYFNYIFQGMAAIILSQNMNQLKIHWGATTTQITLVMSAIGLGRILALYFSGYFSDNFGRKKTVIIGILSYTIFFLGLLLSHSYLSAFFFALFGGFSNAFLDTSTYPTLIEAFPDEKTNSSLSVLNKAFISTGQFLLPFLTRFLIQRELFFGWTFVLCTVCLLINMGYLLFAQFPELSTKKTVKVIKETKTARLSNHGTFKIDGIALLVFSFVSVSIFNIFILWVPQFAEEMQVVSHEDSLTLVSIYSIGSFLSVFLTSGIVKRGVHIPRFIVFCLLASGSALLLMLLVPSFATLIIAAICIGIFAAGGIWQLGLALMLELFPTYKGKYTSYYSLATSVAIMVTPYITGVLSQYGVAMIFWFNLFLLILGLIAAFVITSRYDYLFPKEKAAPTFS